MSLSKTSRKPAVSGNSNVIPPTKALSAEAGGNVETGLSVPFNPKTTVHANAFDDSKLILLTINPDLDKVLATPNLKAESAKQIFANHSDKRKATVADKEQSSNTD